MGTALPYVATMVCKPTNCSPSNHYEDTKSFKKEFCSRGIKLIEAFKHFENTLSDPPEELLNIISKELMSAKASSSVRNALQIDQSQCNVVTKERLNAVNTKPTLHATRSKNNRTLFRCKAAVIVSKEKKQASALKERVLLYLKLHLGCKSRQADLDEFFHHKNHQYSLALSNYGKI